MDNSLIISKYDYNYIKLKILFFIRYLGDSFYYSYFALFLTFRNISESKAGIILAIPPIMMVICNPVWSYICKNVNINRSVMRILTIICGILFIVMSNLTTFETILIVTVLIASLESPFYSLLDGYSSTYVLMVDKKYPPLRMFGSIAYIVGCLLAGLLILVFNYQMLFIVAGCLYIITSVLITLLNKLELKQEEKVRPNYKLLFTNKLYLFYVLYYVLTFSTAMIGDSFYSLHLQNMGLKDSYFGFVYALMVVVEVLTMLLFSRIMHKFKDYQLFIISSVFFFLRLFLIYLDVSLTVSIISCLFRGVGWGLLLMVHMKHLSKKVRIENVTAAILILLMTAALYQSLGTFIIGIVIENYGYSTAYMILSSIVLIVIMFNTYFSIKYNNDKSLNYEHH